jgi:hypothetical protein
MNAAKGKVPADRFYAMTTLDENRARTQLAQKAGVDVTAISNMTIWGNHSATQYPDFYNAKINGKKANEVISDTAWLQGEFIETWHGSMPKKYWMQFIKDSIDQVPLPRPGIPDGLTFNWPSFVQRELKANFKKSTPSSEELNEFFAQCDYKKFTDFNVCRFYPRDIPDALLERIIHDKSWLDANYGHDITKDLIETSISWKGYHQVEIKNWGNARYYFSRYQNLFPENAWELFQMNIFYFKNKVEVDSLIQLGQKNDSFVYDHTSDELAEFIVEHGSKESHYKQAELWNSAELKKAPNFKRAKLQARITVKQADWIEAQKWASLAIEAAKKENLELAVDDHWIIDLAKHGRIKGDG